jgi:hypothetical protein
MVLQDANHSFVDVRHVLLAEAQCRSSLMPLHVWLAYLLGSVTCY